VTNCKLQRKDKQTWSLLLTAAMLTMMHSFVRAYSHAAPSYVADEETTSMRPAPALATGDPRPLTDFCVVSSSPHSESSLILGSDSVRSFKLASHGSSESMRSLASRTSSGSDSELGSLYRLLDVDHELRMAFY